MGQQILTLNAALSELKAAVRVLQVFAANQLRPNDPQDALKAIRTLTKKSLESDPHAQENKDALEMIEAVQKWKKSGGGPVGQS